MYFSLHFLISKMVGGGGREAWINGIKKNQYVCFDVMLYSIGTWKCVFDEESGFTEWLLLECHTEANEAAAVAVDGPEAALGIIEQLFIDSSLSQKDTFGALVAILNAEISEADIQQVILILD